MTRRGRDVYSLSYNYLRRMKSTFVQSHPHNFQSPSSVSSPVILPSFSSFDHHRQRHFVQNLGWKWMRGSLVVSSPRIKFGAPSHFLKLYANARSTVYVSCDSYRTISSQVETVKSDFHLHNQVKIAMTGYLKSSLKIESKLAHDIPQNSPNFVDGLVEKLKVARIDPAPDVNTSVENSIKLFLADSKFTGVEPFLESIGFTPHEIARTCEYARSGINGVLIKLDLLKSMGVKPEDIPKVVYRNPRLLSYALISHQAKVKYLSTLGMSPEEICKMIISYPKALCFVLKDGSLPLVNFLKAAGVKDEEMRKVFIRCPQLLTLNVERKLKPALELLEGVGIKGSSLTRVLVVQPSLLRRKLDRNIAFCREYGLDAKPGVIARLLLTCPNLSVEGWNARVTYLESLGLSKDQIISMVNRNPAFMSLNVQTALAPKIDYLLNVMGRPIEEISTAATFLTLSLEHRIKPRYSVLTALREAGLLYRSYSLSTLGGWSDDDFYKKFVENSPKKIQDMWGNISTRQPIKMLSAAL